MGNEKGMNLLIDGMNQTFWFMRYSCSKILRRFVKEKKIPLEKIRIPRSYFFAPQFNG
jgi:hypothetical protein